MGDASKASTLSSANGRKLGTGWEACTPHFVKTPYLVFPSVSRDCSLGHQFDSRIHQGITVVYIIRPANIPHLLSYIRQKNTYGGVTTVVIRSATFTTVARTPTKNHLWPPIVTSRRVFRCTLQQLRPRFPPPLPPTSPPTPQKNAFAHRWQAPQSPRWME